MSAANSISKQSLGLVRAPGGPGEVLVARQLRFGSRGDDVRELQTQLRAAGHDLALDGLFGPKTRAAVRAFQRARGLVPDGIVGPKTRGALGQSDHLIQEGPAQTALPLRAPSEQERAVRPEGALRPGELESQSRAARARRTVGTARVPVALAPRGASQAEKYEHYRRIIEASGGRMSASGATVLGLRGLDSSGTVRDTRARSEMVDTFVVLSRDAAGRPSVREFTGSSYPAQRSSSQSPDVTRDGRGDVGMIAEGHYSVVPNGLYKGNTSYHVRTQGGSGRLPGVRDTNQDGLHSSAEWEASRRRGDQITSVLFHPGTRAGNVASIGCLNVADWRGFVAAVGGPRGRFEFTLLNAAGPEPR